MEIDAQKNKNVRREELLYVCADQSKKKIEKLKVSEYIKREIEFRNECSFAPAINSRVQNSPNQASRSNSQTVLDRMENWQRKKEAHLSKLSQEAKCREENPSFKYGLIIQTQN